MKTRRDNILERAYYTFAGAILTAWLVLWPFTWFIAPVGLWPCLLALSLGFILRFTPVGGYVLATVGHPSFALVALAAAALTWQAGVWPSAVILPLSATWAKLVFLGLSGVLYASIATALRWDIYAWFYKPLPKLILFLSLALYSYLAQDIFVASIVLGAAILTRFKIGGSNPLDHLHHFLVIPVVLVSLF